MKSGEGLSTAGFVGLLVEAQKVTSLGTPPDQIERAAARFEDVVRSLGPCRGAVSCQDGKARVMIEPLYQARL